MGGFTLPSMPTLPSLPSVRSFINTSPPLVYPKTSNNTPKKSSRTDNDDDDTPTRHRYQIESGHGVSSLLPPSPSVHDVSLEWERVGRGRRGSITSMSSYTSSVSAHTPMLPRSGSSTSLHRGRANGPPNTSLSGSPVRSSHRRSQSLMPKQRSQQHYPGPMGRLHEISRNSMASSSAVSLPTLCEGVSDFPRRTDSVPPSPISVPRSRRLSQSRAQVISPVDMEGDETDTSSVSSHSHVRATTRNMRGHSRTFSSVPPPNAMGPPAFIRPAPSPRSWSVEDVRPNPRLGGNLTRRSSLSITSSTSISDVEVLATWSFPSSPTTEILEERNREQSVDPAQPSDHLRDRLKRLSSLDTAQSTSRPVRPTLVGHPTSMAPPRNQPCRPFAPPKLGRANTTGQMQPTRHRHTHSSPTSLLPLPSISLSGSMVGAPHSKSTLPLLPPPRPYRRPTTSYLRHPNPLSMPQDIERKSRHHHDSISSISSIGGDRDRHVLGSSLGSTSTISDGKSSGSDGEAVTSPASSIISLPSDNVSVNMGVSATPSKGRGREGVQGLGMFGWMSRRELGEGFDRGDGAIERLSKDMRGSLFVSIRDRDDEEAGEEEESERYLSLDDI